MTVLLPREGKSIREVLSTLDADTWLWDLQWMESAEVDVKLPRMDITTNVNLVETMKALGMPSAFDPYEADIPNYCNIPQCISKMFQVAKIKMDEEGTEAAAITVIETTDSGIHGTPKSYEFHADRPFLYIISERSTGAILFIGQYMGENTVSDPTVIGEIQNSKFKIQNEETAIYDLFGRRYESLPSGRSGGGRIYIVNGRKVLY